MKKKKNKSKITLHRHTQRDISQCLSHCSLAVKRQHIQANSYKREHLIGGLLTERARSVIITVLEKELRALH